MSVLEQQVQDAPPPVEQQQEQAADVMFSEVEPSLEQETATEEPKMELTEQESTPAEVQDELSVLAQSMKEEDKEPFQGTIDGYDLKLPKGVSENNELLKQFTKLASENKADPKLVQGSVELLTKYQEKFFNELAQRDQQFRREINNQFIRTNKADPVYGGANYEASVNYAMKALRHFVPKEELTATTAKDGKMGMMEYLQASNSLNATPLWKMLVDVGKHISESAPVIPGAAGPDSSQKSLSDIMFAGIE